ncbi:hypothetical protein K0M31_003394 [Melipona bicolor]|uniref:Uncharacterized protein n=1 Tax=Melipona bicolor TaxID=60889 RepID=A0AA40KPI6_9HYME|nr:hypothetical protein K0M31_003394 [Melipona bicolor]
MTTTSKLRLDLKSQRRERDENLGFRTPKSCMRNRVDEAPWCKPRKLRFEPVRQTVKEAAALVGEKKRGRVRRSPRNDLTAPQLLSPERDGAFRKQGKQSHRARSKKAGGPS